MTPLQDALVAEHDARELHQARCRDVWAALQAEHPVLGETIRTLFPDDATAAHWVCTRHREEASPAEQIAAGDATLVEARLLRIQHGMGA